MNGNEEIVSTTGQDVGITGGRTLSQRIESAFKEAVASRLNGKVPERVSLRVNTKDDGYHPILTFLIQDAQVGGPGTKTMVEIPIGLANPEHDNYFAGINGGGYRRYDSPEDIGYEAAQVFSHNYWVDFRGA
tara:strand:- start:68 stop:463 length:396 start_codon:yes stop_codon:yes gene_type:complete